MEDKLFSKKLDRNYAHLLKFAQNLTHSKTDAEDLIQDASIKALNNLSNLKEETKFRAWFHRILYNTYISKYLKRKRRRKLLEERWPGSEVLFNVSNQNNKALQRLRLKDIQKVMKNIDSKYLKAFKMYVKGYSYKEIAAIENVAIGTVKSRINTARKKMQNHLQYAA